LNQQFDRKQNLQRGAALTSRLRSFETELLTQADILADERRSIYKKE